MSVESSTELLVLHTVRITGFADTPVIASRFDLDPAQTIEVLRDAEAHGWAQLASFADLRGWSLTASGRAEDERQLSAELASAEGIDEVSAVHRDFLPLNTRLQRACTNWQLRPVPGDRLAPNDHADPAWDTSILEELTAIEQALRPLARQLGNILTRFCGYDTRFSHALQRALAGERDWVDRTNIDSCHRVWFELHEDLIATLNIRRGTER